MAVCNDADITTEVTTNEDIKLPESSVRQAPNEKDSNVNEAHIPVATDNISQNETIAGPEEIYVYCLATIDKCPDEVLNHEYGDSLKRFLHSEHHLRENIASSELKLLSTRLDNCGKYVHTVSVVTA